jgi:spore coat polysaccharide biosynthesis predicted glycosyltransferase SpsG
MLAANGIVVDAITAPLRTVWEITRSNPNVAIIDDWHRRNHRKGLVIDWTVGAEEFAYRKKNLGVRYLLGSKYCTIRPAFSNRKQKLIRTRIIRVLLTFGGSDPRGMTTVVSSLLDHHYPDVIQEIVLGPGVDDKISRHFEKHSTSNKIIHRRCSESLMRSLMETADLAVTAGGQTLYELACVGTPTVCIEVVDNQRDDIREFEKKAFLANAGRWSDPRLDSSILAKIRGLQSHDARKAASIKGRKIVDGNGAKRLVSSCLDEWGE